MVIYKSNYKCTFLIKLSPRDSSGNDITLSRETCLISTYMLHNQVLKSFAMEDSMVLKCL